MVTAQAKPVDHKVREQIRTDLTENLCVEAGAGTGKTTSLVARIVEVLASGAADADSLVAMTFMEAAAAELSAGVREGLERAAAGESDPSRSARLEHALRSLHRARIETIHAFCASLLRERPVEAGLDPEFSVLADLEADLGFDQAYRTWLDDLLTGQHPEVERAFNLGINLEMLRAAAEVLHRFRYLLPFSDHPNPQGDVGEVECWLGREGVELEAIAERCNSEEDRGLAVVDRIFEFRRRLEIEGSTEAAKARVVATAMRGVPTNRGRASNWDDPADCPRMKTLFAEWNELQSRVTDALRSTALLDVLHHIERFVLDYAAQRKAEGIADFDDILIWARDLLRERIEVRRYFQRRFRCLLIDEFQDTDPIQAEIAMFLASDGQDDEDWRQLEPTPGKLFVVGDPKQSIFRFRRADIGIYDEIKRGKLSDGIRTIVQNFRSVSPVIEWVNQIFNELFIEREGIQPANVPLKPWTAGQPGRPPVVLIRASSGEDRNADEAREREALSVAAVLRDAITGPTPWLVRDDDNDSLRPAIYRDIAILLPTRAGLEHYEDALAAAGIPHRHEGSRDYFQRQEIRDFVLALAAIDDPADRVSVVGALRSSAFGCSDDDLVIHCASGGILDYRVGVESDSQKVRDALALLHSWHRARRGLSIGEWVQRILAESRLVEFALTLPDGAQAAANLLAIADRAREFAAAGGGGPRPFIRWLIEHSEREANEVDTGITEDADNVIRLMTMHGSKGLEYPIVVLANLANRGRNQREPIPDEENGLVHFRVGVGKTGYYLTPGYEDRWADEQEAQDAEATRLLYVAATRARDYLIVPDLVPDPERRTALEALRPLLPAGSGHEVELNGTWLLDAEQLDLPQPIMEAKPERVAKSTVGAARKQREEWAADLSAASAAAGTELQLTVASSVKRASRPLAAEASHSASTLLMSEGPPLEIGDALHLVMERISLPRAEDLEPIATSTCLEAGIPEHAAEVIEMARRCLAGPTVERALESKAWQREVPFTVRTDDGFALGRVDLVFADDGRLVVVDYKTDAVKASDCEAHAANHYAGQATTYRDGISIGTGGAVSRIVFVYCRSGVEVALMTGPAQVS